MKRLDELLAFQRRVSLSRELNSGLLLEVLELCAEAEVEHIPEKYALLQLCEDGSWEQALLWLMPWTIPHWNVSLTTTINSRGWTVKLMTPVFLITRSHLSCARALLDAIVVATVVDERVRTTKRAAG